MSRTGKAEVLTEAGKALHAPYHSMVSPPAVTDSQPRLGHKSELGDSSTLIWRRPVAQPGTKNGLMESLTDAGQLLVLWCCPLVGCGASLASSLDHSPLRMTTCQTEPGGRLGTFSRLLASGLQHPQSHPMSWMEVQAAHTQGPDPFTGGAQRTPQAGSDHCPPHPTSRAPQAVITAPNLSSRAPAPTQWLQPGLQDLVMLTAPQGPARLNVQSTVTFQVIIQMLLSQ